MRLLRSVLQGCHELDGQLVNTASLGRSLVQVHEKDQLLVDDSMHLAALPEAALQQEAAAAGLQKWGSQGGSRGSSSQRGSLGWGDGWRHRGHSAVEEEALRRFDSSFRYLHGKALGHF